MPLTLRRFGHSGFNPHRPDVLTNKDVLVHQPQPALTQAQAMPDPVKPIIRMPTEKAHIRTVRFGNRNAVKHQDNPELGENHMSMPKPKQFNRSRVPKKTTRGRSFLNIAQIMAREAELDKVLGIRTRTVQNLSASGSATLEVMKKKVDAGSPPDTDDSTKKFSAEDVAVLIEHARRTGLARPGDDGISLTEEAVKDLIGSLPERRPISDYINTDTDPGATLDDDLSELGTAVGTEYGSPPDTVAGSTWDDGEHEGSAPVHETPTQVQIKPHPPPPPYEKPAEPLPSMMMGTHLAEKQWGELSPATMRKIDDAFRIAAMDRPAVRYTFRPHQDASEITVGSDRWIRYMREGMMTFRMGGFDIPAEITRVYPTGEFVAQPMNP